MFIFVVHWFVFQEKFLTEKDKFSVRDSGLEKGQKEIMEQKDNEIKKLTEKCETLQAEIRKLKTDKDAAELEKEKAEKELGVLSKTP